MSEGKRAERSIVVGAGVIGLSTAYYLARRGIDVLVLERKEVGAGASSGNAGAVAPGHGPMTRPGRILQALRWMGDPTSPLYLPPKWNPNLWRWLLRFNSFCTTEHVHRSMELLGPMGHQGRSLMEQLVEEEGLDCGFEAEGYYEVYRTEKGFEGAQLEIPLQKAFGYDTRALQGRELEELESNLRQGTVGGLFFPESATLDPGRFLTELASAVRRRGAQIRTNAQVNQVLSRGQEVRGVELAGGEVLESDSVVLATGAYSLGLAGVGGIKLPIQPAKGYHCDLPVDEGRGPPMSITMMLGERYVFCTPMGDFLRLAGTLELSGLNHTVIPRRLENLTDSAYRYLDGLEGARSIHDWVGLRPVTPDGLPVLGPTPGLNGLFVANGHAMLGLTLGPISGKLLADWIVEGSPPEPGLMSLRPDRF